MSCKEKLKSLRTENNDWSSHENQIEIAELRVISSHKVEAAAHMILS
jgi:hypothetical protein